MIWAAGPGAAEVEAIERLSRIVGPTAAILLVFLTVVCYVLYRLAMAYVKHLKDQLTKAEEVGNEWKNLYIGSMQGARRLVSVADKALDTAER